METNLLSKESIILKIGDIKLSDTDDTFGKAKKVNGYEYKPLLNPENTIFRKQLTADVAYGDYKCGTSISDGQNRILLTYGANRINSNAQNMALGYFDGSQYFFTLEEFGDIYAEKRGRKPELITRKIIACKSLWNHGEKQKMILYRGEIEKIPTKKELEHFNELISRIRILETAFKEENISILRMRENENQRQDSNQER